MKMQKARFLAIFLGSILMGGALTMAGITDSVIDADTKEVETEAEKVLTDMGKTLNDCVPDRTDADGTYRYLCSDGTYSQQTFQYTEGDALMEIEMLSRQINDLNAYSQSLEERIKKLEAVKP